MYSDKSIVLHPPISECCYSKEFIDSQYRNAQKSSELNVLEFLCFFSPYRNGKCVPSGLLGIIVGNQYCPPGLEKAIMDLLFLKEHINKINTEDLKLW